MTKAADRNEMRIRIAGPRDVGAMLEIYADSIRTNIATFEEVSPAESEFAGRLERILRSHPWLVAEIGDQIVGYAFAGPHRPRAGYRWTAEVSVYVDPNIRGRGIGLRLYQSLVAILKAQGFKTLLAIISTPNPASEALHAKFGFTKIGVFENVGFKFGKWQTTCWWQANIGQLESDPSDPIDFAQFRLTPTAESLLSDV